MSKLQFLPLAGVLVCAAACAPPAQAQVPPLAQTPHLEERGQARQLIVDGKPFLMLGGELSNTISSDPEAMKTVWPMLARDLHLNTVLTGIAWDWIEPEEGKFDFRFVDDAIRSARLYDLRLVLLWFGSWKNGLSSFAPAWVKADQGRFPRAKIRDGKTIEILSTFSDANRDADARAFAALLRHVRETDTTHRVILVQVENEVGILGDARDRSAAADRAFAQSVPKELTDYLAQRDGALLPEFRAVWKTAGGKTAGTWAEVFGTGAKAEEIFQGWHYARYVNAVADAGKREYDLPMYVNAWIIQPQDKEPGDYPSGGPQAHMHDVWRAGAPRIDLLCPDIYLPDFAGITTLYTRAGNALFVPESFGGAQGVANAFFAIGNHAALGYSPFGIDRTRPREGEANPLGEAYAILGKMAPAILDAQTRGAIAAAALNHAHPSVEIALGGYTLHVTLSRSFRTPDAIPNVTGYGLFLAAGPDEFLMAGDHLQISFTPATPGRRIASIARQEAGHFESGQWVTTRLLGGDDSVLRYDFAKIVETDQSGSGVRLTGGMQKVKLYRYE